MHTIQGSPIGSNGQTAFSPPPFGISAAREGNAYVIRIEGELDLCECPHLESALRKAEVSPVGRILLDLDELAFIDAAGLSVLVMAWRRSASNGDRLRVSHARDYVAYLLHLTALDTVLPFIRA